MNQNARSGCVSAQAGDIPGNAVHNFALTILGIHLIDRADFDALSEAAAARNRWEFMLTIAPLPIPRGTGSPVNPIAVFSASERTSDASPAAVRGGSKEEDPPYVLV